LTERHFNKLFNHISKKLFNMKTLLLLALGAAGYHVYLNKYKGGTNGAGKNGTVKMDEIRNRVHDYLVGLETGASDSEVSKIVLDLTKS